MCTTTIDVKQLKVIQIQLLNVLDNFCKSNGLTYFLAFGTLLGAIRHKGYIPWDDDIDVIMPRQDYERFISLFNNNCKEESSIKVLSHKIDKDYYLPFAKLVDTNTVMKEDADINYEIGVYIDIFPLDNLSNNFYKAKNMVKKGNMYNNLWRLKIIAFNKNRSLLKNLILLIGKTLLFIVSNASIVKMIDEFSRSNNSSYSYTNYVGVIPGSPYICCFKREWFEKTIKVPFEGRYYSAAIGSDALLSEIYGNYMKLPPIEKRISHHSFTAWYKK